MTMSRAEWPARVERWRDLIILGLVVAGSLAIPLVFRRDPSGMFRLPKAIALRAEAILILSVFLGSIVLGTRMSRLKWRDPWLLGPLAAFVAFVLLTITSTNHTLSVSALETAAATLIVFLATVAAARVGRWILVAVPLVAACANALLVVVEEANLWMPFGEHPELPHHLQCDALIGNPNEVGGYLGAALLAALAAIAAKRSGTRWKIGDVLLVAMLGAALFACQTLTAIIAFILAALVMIALSSWKRAMGVAGVTIISLVIIVAVVVPLRQRAVRVSAWFQSGEYNEIVSERFTPFAAASLMFIDHPLTGVGPGAFSWQYFDYKIRAEQKYPSLRRAYARGINFGEVHNDHLQALAEGGLVGYTAFIALLGALAALSFTAAHPESDAWQRFAHTLALPLAVFWVVLSLAQFPMETTVVRTLLVHFAALCAGWSNR
jgi:O-antigen ligase